MEIKKFDNAERRRYYGLRIGDTVKLDFFYYNKKEEENPLAEVIEYGAMDNNRVHVRLENGKEMDYVAEWCTIVEKVEDK
jgi:hypothetical protein